MAKAKSLYVCSECGATSTKWNGKCFECGAWNTMVESLPAYNTPTAKSGSLVTLSDSVRKLDAIGTEEEVRYLTGMGELDRVLGGGLVKGSIVLLGGAPGIGKSTLLLQICQFLGKEHQVLYVSGEESARQIKLRADRLQVNSDRLSILTGTDAEAVSNTIQSLKPEVVIIDSIQTMSISALSSSPGSITQVRECTNLFMHTAKSLEIPIFIVGHVNKDGAIAGPKVMEHIVDAVLYFEGERNLSCRILRAVKNRFGSTNEIGVFDMQDVGLKEVANPSAMLLEGRPHGVSGTCVSCVMEGSRPILAEVQALATKSSLSVPRRTSTGFDFSRLAILLAVLEKRQGIFFGGLDVYLNIVGGFRLDEPAADLAVALALYSSVMDMPLPENLVAFGEIGLGGEVRTTSYITQRVNESARMGFEICIVPKQALSSISKNCPIRVIGISNLKQGFSFLQSLKEKEQPH